MVRRVISLFFLWSVAAFGNTTVQVDTTPVKATVFCDEKSMGTVPVSFGLEDGSYNCSLKNKLTEPVYFELTVRGEEKIKVSLILVPGKMTDAQKKVSIHRTLRKN